MSLIGDVVTIEQIAVAATDELVTLYNWVKDEIASRGQTALLDSTQAEIKAVDDAVDLNEDAKFPKGDG
jgi:hypothetical protein